MNMRFILFLFGWWSFILMSEAQVASPMDIAKMTPPQLDALIKNANWPEVQRKLVAEAIATKRIDLIQVCFANPETVRKTYELIVALPDGELKQRSTIMMLRTPSSLIWPNENPFTYSSGIIPPVMIEPFISVIPRLLPKVELSENWLKYQVGRKQLADDMEAVLNAKAKAVLETKNPQQVSPNKQDIPSPMLPALESGPVQPKATAPQLLTKVAEPKWFVYWALAGAIIAFTLARLMRRKVK